MRKSYRTNQTMSNSTTKDKKQSRHWGSVSWNFLALTYPTNTKLVVLRNTLWRCKFKKNPRLRRILILPFTVENF